MPFTFGVPVGRCCCRAIRYSSPYQSVSKSADRVRFRSKNFRHACGYSAATGRLTTTQATAAPPNVQANARIRLVRRHSASSGSRNSPGYSFAAAPSPSSTPATPGRRRCQATNAAPASATANRSQFVKACRISSGHNATIAASQTRRRDSAAVLQVTTSMQAASINTVTVKYVCTGGMAGSTPPARWSYCRPSQAATPM
jgi:hypothetical protein